MAASGVKKRARSDSPQTDIYNQENVSTPSHASKVHKKKQVRNRASVACSSCRDRRIRCVVPKGESECNQCKRTGIECIIKNDDERRRPISKAYMSSLLDRINMLESMLLEKGVVLPPAVHPPKTKLEASREQHRKTDKEGDEIVVAKQEPDISLVVPSPPDSTNEDFQLQESDQTDSGVSLSSDAHESPPNMELDILSSKQNESELDLLWSPNTLSGQLLCFGSATDGETHSAESSDTFKSNEPCEDSRQKDHIIGSVHVTKATHEYLMVCFWDHFNEPLLLIDKEAFEADHESQRPNFYSSFLHITILAMGYRYADKTREDMVKISVGNRQSTLQQEAKRMLDKELEKPGAIPSIQALLILADLEFGIGRGNTGWIYATIAHRLAMDIGLQLQSRDRAGLTQHETLVCHGVMRACAIFDKYWAPWLERSTSTKSQESGTNFLSRQLSSMLSNHSRRQAQNKQKTLTAEIHNHLVELIEMTGSIIEMRDTSSRLMKSPTDPFAPQNSDDEGYRQMIHQIRRLQIWHKQLPEKLVWNPANVKNAPSGFFLLHQQYHVSLILMHSPWAMYNSALITDSADTSPSPEKSLKYISTSRTDANRRTLARNFCIQQAIRIARLFWQHQQRFNGRRMSVNVMLQHARTAAIALITAIKDVETHKIERQNVVGYLEAIANTVHDMSEMYQPAERLDTTLKTTILQLKADLNNAHHHVNEDELSQRKRPRLAASRRASELARPPPPFFAQPTGHSKKQNSLSYDLNSHTIEPSTLGLFCAMDFDILASLGSTSHDSTIDIDTIHDHSRGTSISSSTCKNIWGPQEASTPDFGIHMSDWAAGCLGYTSLGLDNGPKTGGSANMILSKPSSTHSSKDTAKTKGNFTEKSSLRMDWMDNKARSPIISLADLVEKVEKVAGAGAVDTVTCNSTPRMHELDFFSF